MAAIVCPCCRASNETGPNCRRCAADLSLLFHLESDREALLACAGRQLAAGRVAEALRILNQAEMLRPGADIARLRAVANLLNLDYRTALQNHGLATNT